MNAVEIEEAISALAEEPYDAEVFPYAFLEAFGNKPTTIKRLKSGSTNSSDINGGVLQRNNIHLAVCQQGEVTDTLAALRNSPATAKARVKFILATDGTDFEAEGLNSGETVACAYEEFPNHFGFFLELAGISTVKQLRDSAFDIRATARLNKLYVELLRSNPEWGTAERRHEMNHFMAKLIFCFFAEDTDIFGGQGLFTSTIEQMSARDSSNTHEIISTLFLAMNTEPEEREQLDIPRWADKFPYVNGGLFAEGTDAPEFPKIARSYLLHIGSLDWTKINPDIFGSMIQAVADEEERGALGLHYTSVSNILKVLNPLFLDDLRAQLEEADHNGRKLLNLRKRMAKIRVFDPACGSGNFLVIAYKEMRAIEAKINNRRSEEDLRTKIPLTNFRGIELRNFPSEIARLALIIAEYQCDVLYRGQQEAIREFLPLDAMNWVTCGNALHIDWLTVCPPTGTGVKILADDLFETPLDQAEIDFENEGGETYICGNPPYLGGKKQSPEQKADMESIFGRGRQFKNLDYISAFLLKAAQYLNNSDRFAFVTTSSLNQGTHVPTLWPRIYEYGASIYFCYTPFKWANSAAKNAGVFVNIIGLSKDTRLARYMYFGDTRREAKYINAYLVDGSNKIVEPQSSPLSNLDSMITGNAPYDGGNLLLESADANTLRANYSAADKFLRRVTGTSEFNDGKVRWCIWIDDSDREIAERIPPIQRRIAEVLDYRRSGGDVARSLVDRPHQFRYRHTATKHTVLVPQISSESRPYIPIGFLEPAIIPTHLVHVLYDGGLVSFALLSSKLHQVWVKTVSGRLGNGIRYSSNICWNTFPVPILTRKNKSDLTRTAEDILLAREACFPATIADIYDSESMPENLREAHDRNDEVLERIFIGRRFRNDTERLEKLFELYTKMTSTSGAAQDEKADSQ